jgi:DNA-binding GntR family transcriptional regulator
VLPFATAASTRRPRGTTRQAPTASQVHSRVPRFASRASGVRPTTDLPPAERNRGSETFHWLIAAGAENARLTRMIDELHGSFPRNILVQLLAADPRYCAANFAEHDAIVDALEAGDAETAGSLMREHLLRAGEQLSRWFEQRSSTVFRG